MSKDALVQPLESLVKLLQGWRPDINALSTPLRWSYVLPVLKPLRKCPPSACAEPFTAYTVLRDVYNQSSASWSVLMVWSSESKWIVCVCLIWPPWEKGNFYGECCYANRPWHGATLWLISTMMQRPTWAMLWFVLIFAVSPSCWKVFDTL